MVPMQRLGRRRVQGDEMHVAKHPTSNLLSHERAVRRGPGDLNALHMVSLRVQGFQA